MHAGKADPCGKVSRREEQTCGGTGNSKDVKPAVGGCSGCCIVGEWTGWGHCISGVETRVRLLRERAPKETNDPIQQTKPTTRQGVAATASTVATATAGSAISCATHKRRELRQCKKETAVGGNVRFRVLHVDVIGETTKETKKGKDTKRGTETTETNMKKETKESGGMSASKHGDKVDKDDGDDGDDGDVDTDMDTDMIHSLRQGDGWHPPCVVSTVTVGKRKNSGTAGGDMMNGNKGGELTQGQGQEDMTEDELRQVMSHVTTEKGSVDKSMKNGRRLTVNRDTTTNDGSKHGVDGGSKHGVSLDRLVVTRAAAGHHLSCFDGRADYPVRSQQYTLEYTHNSTRQIHPAMLCKDRRS